MGLSGEERRKKIEKILKENKTPVSGTKLAELLHVSRQVIVQDIALLRATKQEVLSTTKGYYIQNPKRNFERIVKVRHNDEETEKEMNAIVDLGGHIMKVFVWHKVYGRIEADMNVKSRKDVQDFMEKLKAGVSVPLKNVTDNYHYHVIEAETPEILDQIEEALQKLGYWVTPDMEEMDEK